MLVVFALSSLAFAQDAPPHLAYLKSLTHPESELRWGAESPGELQPVVTESRYNGIKSTSSLWSRYTSAWSFTLNDAPFTGRIVTCMGEPGRHGVKVGYVFDVRDGNILWKESTRSQNGAARTRNNPIGHAPLWPLGEAHVHGLLDACLDGSAADASLAVAASTDDGEAAAVDGEASLGDLSPVGGSAAMPSGSVTGGTIASLTATSTLKSQGSNSYAATNAGDKNPATAWVEGESDGGVGKSLQFKAAACSGLVVMNGYQKSQGSFSNNARVADLAVSADGAALAVLKLEDRPGEQHFDLALPAGAAVSLTVRSTYAGAKWQDTAISEVWQVCD